MIVPCQAWDIRGGFSGDVWRRDVRCGDNRLGLLAFCLCKLGFEKCYTFFEPVGMGY